MFCFKQLVSQFKVQVFSVSRFFRVQAFHDLGLPTSDSKFQVLEAAIAEINTISVCQPLLFT